MNQAAFDFSGVCKKRRGRYYVTTPLTPDQFAGAMVRAENQDEAVMAVFRRHVGEALTPSRVHAITSAAGKRWPQTSVRRSISTLTKDGLLEKTGDTVAGPMGMPEHTWRLPARAAA